MNKRLNGIVAYVDRVRAELGIETGVQGRPEPSGIAYDEFELLLDFQLLYTKKGLGAWATLKDEAILQAVYEVVRRREAHAHSDAPR